MIVKRYWVKRKKFSENRFFCGWFLFGFIPPGWFIGFHGWLVDKYRNILKENGYPYDVRFVDLFCGDVKEF